MDGAAVPLSELVKISTTTRDAAIYHKDLLPVVYVTGDMAGRLDSPLYGMLSMVRQVRSHHRARRGGRPALREPAGRSRRARHQVGWEWQITYETFRDMGLAYSVGLVLIYLLVVAQLGSYALPLIIMAPISSHDHRRDAGPCPARRAIHRDLQLIGMIALAGIIVRNSILLVDFIDSELRAGCSLEDAVVRAGVIRAKLIALTALAAMIGAFFILDDPIFNGLAVSADLRYSRVHRAHAAGDPGSLLRVSAAQAAAAGAPGFAEGDATVMRRIALSRGNVLPGCGRPSNDSRANTGWQRRLRREVGWLLLAKARGARAVLALLSPAHRTAASDERVAHRLAVEPAPAETTTPQTRRSAAP